MSERATLPRSWRLRTGDAHLEDAEPSAVLADPTVRDTASAISTGCTVLLGPPGAGKSTALGALVHSSPSPVRMVSFGSTGSEDHLRSLVAQALSELNGGGGAAPILALDSLDETTLATPQLASFIGEIAAAVSREARLVLACRTAAWLPGVQKALENRYGEHLRVYDLAPLRRQDIVAYASSAGVDGEEFLNSVEAASVFPIAQSPNTLRLLLDTYLDDRERGLPGSQASLFGITVERMLREPNIARQVPGQLEDVQSLLACAGRAAVMSLFTGRPVIRLVGGAGTGELGLEDLGPWDEGRVEAGGSVLKRVLGSALFVGAGDQLIRFAHQTLAEYLAARHLLDLAIDAPQVSSLLRGRGGLLAPQIQAVAAWLVGLSPSRFIELLQEDPAAFIASSVEMNDPTYRHAIVDGLFALAARGELLDTPPSSLGGLWYSGLSEQLLSVLGNPLATFDERYLSIRLARANRVRDLTQALTDLTLSEDEPIPLRNAAGRTVLEIGGVEAVSLIVSLADGEAAEFDTDDELFGLGLMAKLRLGRSLSEVLPVLRAPRNDNFWGNYRSLLVIELPRAVGSPELPSDDLVAAGVWAADLELASDINVESLSWPEDRLTDAILLACLGRLGDQGVVQAAARLIGARLRSGRTILRDSLTREALPELSRDVRLALLAAIQPDLDSIVGVWGLARAGLLRAHDLPWVLDRASFATTQPEREQWVDWVRATFDPSVVEHRNAVADFVAEHADYAGLLAFLLKPRPDWTEVDIDEDAADTGHVPTDEELRADLLELLSSEEPDAFLRLCHVARWTGGQRYSTNALPLDVRRLPGWHLLPASSTDQIMAAARRYLENTQPDFERYFGTSTFGWDVIAGVRALALLLTSGQGRALEDWVWGNWVPAIVLCSFNDDSESTMEALLAEAARRVPAMLLDATERQMVGENGWSALESVVPLLGPSQLPWLLRLVDDQSADVRSSTLAATRIAVLDPDTALGRMSGWLNDHEPLNRTSALLCAMISAIGDRAWEAAYPTLLDDDELARSVIESLSSREQAYSLSEAHTVELWELVYGLFPPETDPDMMGVHTVGVREQVAFFRDRLLPAVASLGSPAALEALQALADRKASERWIRRYVAQARAARRQADWSPLSVDELRQVVARGRRVLRSDADLLEAVIQGLGTIEARLTGATPQATLLWDHHRPYCDATAGSGCLPKVEDDISDYLADHLAPLLPESVVNREVQVVRLHTRGLGKKTDLLIEVPAAGDRGRDLRVVVEVKGCWNDDIPAALQTQLVDTYLRRWPSAAGLFLVAWFDPEHGASRGSWLRDADRNSRDRLIQLLNAHVEAAGGLGDHVVRSLVLDCSMPTQADVEST